ncbi:hypothetical protein BDY19DRAFT_1051915 [Irpex rosettiformis]|uniref:Uncharacterized protein n=1 Tax=Irpex rosettiformis TaxID=378272 RepID=A0ACB8TMS8_9APHY|nr:hypothetical protein BDY19DRAFT_1051915 [Irpex rosettiformis]
MARACDRRCLPRPSKKLEFEGSDRTALLRSLTSTGNDAVSTEVRGWGFDVAKDRLNEAVNAGEWSPAHQVDNLVTAPVTRQANATRKGE